MKRILASLLIMLAMTVTEGANAGGGFKAIAEIGRSIVRSVIDRMNDLLSPIADLEPEVATSPIHMKKSLMYTLKYNEKRAAGEVSTSAAGDLLTVGME